MTAAMSQLKRRPPRSLVVASMAAASAGGSIALEAAGPGCQVLLATLLVAGQHPCVMAGAAGCRPLSTCSAATAAAAAAAAAAAEAAAASSLAEEQ
eukprot:CAMPEP_0203929144 /NCGR_PEP_ID=MMETSP0359-20131031/68089_1 /ASSEMBLY_ACC=CAM_ASM_000338 /TAXON_ID=268821 /ORGANISM="Scrippsiella Hangoei, Strain SHTV-5" /LENGTH=95 /DNA_ID=CAMNT_0050858129 /DNA_START=5 /DNA_END=290 /DNA_ORIENTATION=+